MSEDEERRSAPRFGGSWTETKLAIVADYLRAYTRVLGKKPTPQRPFELGYIDAFAGAGKRVDDSGDDASLFGDAGDDDAAGLRKGSVQIALDSAPPFHRFLFIDRDRAYCAELESLRRQRPHIKDQIDIRCGDANTELLRVCVEDWRDRRAAVFLDPFATAVRWTTLEAIAATQAMDTWILFPLMAVNRMLTKSGTIPESWSTRIDEVLGTNRWRDHIYKKNVRPGLFGQDETDLVKAGFEEIGRFFLDRLKTIFVGVAEHAKILTTSTRSPLFLLCFAAANPKGAPIAVRIANDLLKRID